MKRITLWALTLCLTAPAARADQIRWGYDWTAFPGEVPTGNSRVVFSNEPYRTAEGSTGVVATNLTVASTADAAKPDVFGPNQGYYALVMGLQDLASGQWGAVLFQGQLQGRISADSSELTHRLLGPATQKLVLGETEFTVTLDTFAAPAGPRSDNKGSIGATVSVAPVSRQQTPEPSSLVLAALGLSAAGLAAWRRRRVRGCRGVGV